ncbi:MAG: hypothetical protein HUU15_05475 [Candidatus Brocadiae bacterium]|nr:hypothetical protein [Candidatus Brocadiia bacterium]
MPGHQRVFLSEEGASFRELKDSGIEFPEVTFTPTTPEGTVDTAKATRGRYEPACLYCADVGNDGDADALAGVHSNRERFDGEGWEATRTGARLRRGAPGRD